LGTAAGDKGFTQPVEVVDEFWCGVLLVELLLEFDGSFDDSSAAELEVVHQLMEVRDEGLGFLVVLEGTDHL
jgi:hypothetical protein